VLRRIDISNWKSPVAQQYHIQSIPHLIVYNPDGKRVNEGLFSLDGPLEGGVSYASWILIGLGSIILIFYVLSKISSKR